MRYNNEKGIIIRKKNLGENDHLLTVFTESSGKIFILSRGSRKSTAKKNGHLEPLNLCFMQLYKLNDKYLVTEAKNEKCHLKIKQDLKKTLTAQTICEIFDLLTPEQEENKDLYDLLKSSLKKLENGKYPETLLEEFKIRFLKIQGFLPEMNKCFNNGKKWEKTDTITIDENGRPRSEIKNQKKIKVSFNTIKFIHFIANSPFEQKNFNLSEEESLQLKQITNIILNNILNKEIKSENYLSLASI